MVNFQQDIIDTIRQSAVPLNQNASDFPPLIELVKNKSFILLGEATHGTHEFYKARVDITKRLIIEHGLNAIAIEGDWPAAYRVNQYIRWQNNDTNANEALSDFKRFPMWMWRNRVILEFVEWLRKHNQGLDASHKVGFYGLDMYSLYESVAAVLEYLDQIDPDAAKEARNHYACLDHNNSGQLYGYGVNRKHRPSCEDEVVAQLIALRSRSMVYAKPGDHIAEDDQFQAEQNAYLVKSAESYYRQMFNGGVNTWNLRDTHMIETLDNLHKHLSKRINGKAKITVWEHNSHVGDARATYMHDRFQHNVGQVARELYGNDCTLIGFTTYTGTVTAATDWNGPAERKKIRPALPGSIEDIFHKTNIKEFYLPLIGKVAKAFSGEKEERAIGVIYLPKTERASHYFLCRLADQFDAVFHYDDTTALEPLDPTSEWIKGEEGTFPFGV